MEKFHIEKFSVNAISHISLRSKGDISKSSTFVGVAYFDRTHFLDLIKG